MTTASALEGGFAQPPHQSAHAFRAIMEAMARPGTLHDIGGARAPAPLSVAAGTALLTLCDPDTPVHLAGSTDRPEVRDWIAFHIGAPVCGPDGCHFALGAWDDLQPLGRFPVGTTEYPDRSATLIVEMPELAAIGARLRGPGIRDVAALSLPETAAFADNHRLFPLGLDFLFTCGSRLAALPRSTKVT